MDKLIQILNANPAVAGWKLKTEELRSCEIYYVFDKLETNRSTSTVSHKATIYIDKDGKRGSSTFSVYDYMSEEELKEKLETNLYAASFALNPFYEIPGPEDQAAELSEEASLEMKSSSDSAPSISLSASGKSLEAMLEELSDAVFRANVYAEGSLNATEFFLYEKTTRIRNSKGIDVSHTGCSGLLELIPTWTVGEEEVEVYEQIRFGSFDPEELYRQTAEQLLEAKARFEARPLREVLPASAATPPVLLSNGEVHTVFRYFADDLTYANKYQHSNRFELGDVVQGDTITGTLLNMQMVPSYEGAIQSSRFDADGLELKPIDLIRDGKAVNRYGSYRFGYYLGIDKPVGVLPILKVQEGSRTIDEMKAAPYLRLTKFSDMQMDRVSGFFGGEVRLGYYFDGEKEIPVTGFTVSGNLKDLAGSMLYSAETVTLTNYHGPKMLEIHGMTLQ